MSRSKKGPELVIIAAVAAKDRLIGDGMKLPWHIPEDLAHFKRLTRGHPLLMGRRTFESIIVQFGKPLPDRRHLVLTSDPENVSHPAAECFTDLDQALEAVKDEPLVFVAGGATVYGEMLDKVDRLELTIVEGDFEGDTYFPKWEHLVGSVFTLTRRDEREGFRFERYERR